MARLPSPLQRLTAACAVLALSSLLLGPPPYAANADPPSDGPLREIGTSVAALAHAPPGVAKAGTDLTLSAARLPAAPDAARLPAASPPGHGRGGESPALVRWRLAHGTSTASP